VFLVLYSDLLRFDFRSKGRFFRVYYIKSVWDPLLPILCYFKGFEKWGMVCLFVRYGRLKSTHLLKFSLILFFQFDHLIPFLLLKLIDWGTDFRMHEMWGISHLQGLLPPVWGWFNGMDGFEKKWEFRRERRKRFYDDLLPLFCDGMFVDVHITVTGRDERGEVGSMINQYIDDLEHNIG